MGRQCNSALVIIFNTWQNPGIIQTLTDNQKETFTFGTGLCEISLRIIVANRCAQGIERPASKFPWNRDD